MEEVRRIKKRSFAGKAGLRCFWTERNAGVSEKKRILQNEYGMAVTEELEGRMRDMCNLSELVEERGIKKGITQGITQERIAAIGGMMKAGITKEQIISCGYTEKEIEKSERALRVNA